MNKNTKQAKAKGLTHFANRVFNNNGRREDKPCATPPAPILKGVKVKSSHKDTGKAPRIFNQSTTLAGMKKAGLL